MITYSIIIAMTIAAILVSAVPATAAYAQTQTSTAVSGSFADIQTVQDSEHIVITVTKAGAEPPTGPVVVIPEPGGEDGNGTIVIPEENATDTTGGNETDDVIVIEPDGNVTQVPGNVTNIDNSTVIVAPDNQTVTETDGGVIVVDPVPCGCPSSDEAEEPPATEPLPPLIEEPVTNDTMLVPAPEEPIANGTSEEGTVTEDNGGNNSNNNNDSNPLSDMLGLQS